MSAVLIVIGKGLVVGVFFAVLTALTILAIIKY